MEDGNIMGQGGSENRGRNGKNTLKVRGIMEMFGTTSRDRGSIGVLHEPAFLVTIDYCMLALVRIYDLPTSYH